MRKFGDCFVILMGLPGLLFGGFLVVIVFWSFAERSIGLLDFLLGLGGGVVLIVTGSFLVSIGRSGNTGWLWAVLLTAVIMGVLIGFFIV